MRAIQRGRAAESAWSVVVNGWIDEILIRGCGRGARRGGESRAAICEPGESIRELEVQVADSTERRLHVVHKFYVQCVVDGASDRLQENCRSQTGIDALKCALESERGFATADAQVRRGIQSETAKVRHRGATSGTPARGRMQTGAGSDSSINRRSTTGAQGGRDRLLRGGFVKETHVAA